MSNSTLFTNPRSQIVIQEFIKTKWCPLSYKINSLLVNVWSHGVMVSTLDFESSDPSSNLGETCNFFQFSSLFIMGIPHNAISTLIRFLF